jgi:hypothetical protein
MSLEWSYYCVREGVEVPRGQALELRANATQPQRDDDQDQRVAPTAFSHGADQVHDATKPLGGADCVERRTSANGRT